MRTKITLLTALFAVAFSSLYAQSTAIRVYDILQEKCVSCHSNAAPEAGLDLEGAGANVNAQMADVLSNIKNVTPSNAYAASKGYKYIYPGRADKSYLFRKINQGLEETVVMHEDEFGLMPNYQDPLSETEQEIIRQWILYGAPTSGEVVDADMIETYYTTNNGLEAFPDGAPDAPAEADGFQVKMGSFFLEPNGEVEYYQKYELDLPEDQEVTRIDIMISDYSHHFLIYDFEPGGGNSIPEGLRLNAFHNQIGLVAAVQGPTDLRLPEGTAFRWEEGLVLDLNSHYINYSATNIYKAEVYLNIYTQPIGTAIQEMQTELIANTNIWIPNNGDIINESEVLNYNLGEIYLWGLMGHTHQYGTGYTAHRRLNGQEDELIYDASCPNGVPNCASPYFDYQHIPMRYFDLLEPLTMNFSNGIIHEATWINDGPQSVGFGPTSDDEMMVMVMMYTEDSTGIAVNNPTGIYEVPQLTGVQVAPNPMKDLTMITLLPNAGEIEFKLYDILGRIVQTQTTNESQLEVPRNGLNSGLYTYRIEAENGRVASGKLLLE